METLSIHAFLCPLRTINIIILLVLFFSLGTSLAVGAEGKCAKYSAVNKFLIALRYLTVR